MASKAKVLFGGTFKSLALFVMGVIITVAGVAYAGRLAIRTWNETATKTKIVYVVEDSAGREVRTVHEIVSPGNAARVVLRGLRRGTYTVTPYAWMRDGAWRASTPLSESRAVSVDRGGVEVAEFAIAGSGGGGGGTGEVAGWPNGRVFLNNTGSPFASGYSMKHPTHTGGVAQNYTFDATVLTGQAGFNDKIPFGTGSALLSWSGTINVAATGGNSGVAFGENVGLMIDPTTCVTEFVVVNGAFVARAPAAPAGKRGLVSFEEIAPGVFVGTMQ